MVQGMTGFGSGEKDGFRVEVRSLNHRFMDVSIKLPAALARHEIALREALKERFRRGKFDVYVSTLPGAGMRVGINKEMARELYLSLAELKEELSLSGDIGVDTLLNWKELVVAEEASFDADALHAAFGIAVEELEDMRMREGKELADELISRADTLEQLNREVMSLSDAVWAEGRERFLIRVREFLPGGYEEGRLIQEAASAAEKADISEEVSRLENHIRHLKKILSAGGAIGRKLDFVLQEINREANTIASKADDHRVLNIVIEMKAEAEKAREQAQNVQ
jgi:uncharacterized protein (TIGR00255 family)